MANQGPDPHFTYLKKGQTRRSFLGVIAASGAALIGAFPLVRALANLPPAQMGESAGGSDQGWQLLLSTRELRSGALAKPGKPRRVVLRSLVADRWQMREQQLPVYVTRTGDALDALQVFSSVCPHAGCVVEYQSDDERYHCPCHDGYFDAKGEVTDGPPPRGLDPLPFRVTEEGLEIRVVRYRLNVEERVEL